MRTYRSNTNRLANLKNNTVVSKAIQRDKDIKTTQRSTNFGYAAASLLIPGGFLTGIGRKAIGQAFKKAGSLYKNVRSANTTRSKALQDATLKDFKMKNLSKGFHSKTGVTPRKRVDKHNTASHNPEDGFQPNFGAEGGTSRGSLLKYRKDMGIVEGKIKVPNDKPLSSYRYDKAYTLSNKPSSAKGSLLFSNKTLKSHIDAMNKASRKKPKK